MPDQTPRFGLNNYAIGETPWDHTDAVQLIDELAVERDTIANRPASGSYDDELFLATDQLTLYQWDESAAAWSAVAGLGTSGSPLPFYASTLNGADLENATAGTVPTAQGDGSLSMAEAGGSGTEVFGGWEHVASYSNSGATATNEVTFTTAYDELALQLHPVQETSNRSITLQVNGVTSGYSPNSEPGGAGWQLGWGGNPATIAGVVFVDGNWDGSASYECSFRSLLRKSYGDDSGYVTGVTPPIDTVNITGGDGTLTLDSISYELWGRSTPAP